MAFLFVSVQRYILVGSFFKRKSSWVIFFFFSFFCVGCIKTLGQKPDEQRNRETEKQRNGETDRQTDRLIYTRLDISFKTEMNIPVWTSLLKPRWKIVLRKDHLGLSLVWDELPGLYYNLPSIQLWLASLTLAVIHTDALARFARYRISIYTC